MQTEERQKARRRAQHETERKAKAGGPPDVCLPVSPALFFNHRLIAAKPPTPGCAPRLLAFLIGICG